MKCKVLIAHVLKFSSLSPALEKFLDRFANLLKIIQEFNIYFPIYLRQIAGRGGFEMATDMLVVVFSWC